MKHRIPDKFRSVLSNKYLDWAEMLPKFGPIARLQQIREHQRRQSNDAYQRSRPPEGVTVEYRYFRLFEIFHIEDLDQLIEGCLRLFPKLENELTGNSFSSNLRKQAGQLSGGASWNLGVIIRDRKNSFFFGGASKEMSDLPEDVNHIGAWLYQILPSLFVVTFDVCLTDRATEQLSRLQNSHYLADVRFAQLFPRNYARSFTMPATVMQREILGWLKQLRGRVEICLKPYLSGYFMRHSRDKIARLPAFEVYILKGVPTGEKEMVAWLKTARGWWDSLGFSFIPHHTYSDNKQLFIPSTDFLASNQSVKPTHRLVVLWESYLKTVETDGHGDDKTTVIEDTQDLLSGILPHFAILEFLNIAQARIEKLRKSVFGRLNAGRLPNILLGPQINLNDEILQTSMLLDRISSEFDQEKYWITHFLEALIEVKEELRRIENPHKQQPDGLRENLLENINFRVKLLNTHLTLIKEWFSQYLALRNMAATYWLAVIVGVVSIIGVVGIANIQNFISNLLTIISKFIVR